MSNPEVHSPAPAVGSPTEEQEATGRGAGEQAHGASAPGGRATVAESLADIRADRIIADARREAQAIVDKARVDARREARAIVESARSEAETIITEAFEQRARIVRRDWAIGDGSWSLAGAEDAGEGGDAGEEPVAVPGPSAGAPTPAEGTPVPVVDAAGEAGRVDAEDEGEDAPEPAPGVPQQHTPDVAPRPGPGVPQAVPEVPPHQGPELTPRRAPEVVPRQAPEAVPRQMPDAAAAKLSELIELPALRARERLVPASLRTEPPHEARPPLPARIRRRPASVPRNGPPAPPPPPPPAPPAEGRAPRPRPRIERELPAGMRIPPDVPDWDDYDDAEDR